MHHRAATALEKGILLLSKKIHIAKKTLGFQSKGIILSLAMTMNNIINKKDYCLEITIKEENK